jgi:tetratricopeptide (TPR) repeat protein
MERERPPQAGDDSNHIDDEREPAPAFGTAKEERTHLHPDQAKAKARRSSWWRRGGAPGSWLPSIKEFLRSGRLEERIKTVEDLTKRSAGFSLNIVTVAGLVFVAVIVAIESRRDTVQIHAILGPKWLAESGYDPEVLAQIVMDDLLVIEKQSETSKKMKRLAVDQTSPDIILPGTGVSLAAVEAYLRGILGDRQTQVTGEITQLDPESHILWLNVRLNRKSVYLSPYGMNAANLDFALREASKNIIKASEPYVYVSYLYVLYLEQPPNPRDDLPERRDEIMSNIDHIIATLPSSDEDVARAYNLRGIMFEEERSPEQAMQAFNAAIQLDPDLSVAHLNLGRIPLSEGKYEKAIPYIRRAALLDPSADNLLDLGALLLKTDRYSEAAATYRRAIALDPTDSESYFGLGLALGSVASTMAKSKSNMPGRMQVQTQACDAFQESIRLHSTPTLRKAIILQVIPGLGIECSIE